MKQNASSQSDPVRTGFGFPAVAALLSAALTLLCAPAVLAQSPDRPPLVLRTEASAPAPSGSPALAETYARYEASRRAVKIAARYFRTQGRIENFGRQKDEIYSLATKKIQAKTLEAGWTSAAGVKRYRVRIESRIYPADFYAAQILAQKLAEEQRAESLRQEMEPKIAAEIDPAKDLARAYGYFRSDRFREGLIYLDRLESKYPRWGEISMAKAIAFYALQDPVRMQAALQAACAAEIVRACEDLKTLKQVHDLDFGP